MEKVLHGHLQYAETASKYTATVQEGGRTGYAICGHKNSGKEDNTKR